jgi:Glycosyl transferase family 2
MNEVLRILDRLLKRYGYTIKKQPEFNLSPLKDFTGLEDQKKVYDIFNSSQTKSESNIESLTVCLRTSINDKRAKGKRSDLTNVGLEEHLLRCINSLIVSIDHACVNNLNVRFVIFDDRSDEAVLEKIKSLCEKLRCDWNIITTDKPGQGESLYQNFEYARNCSGLFYFCEDDYLHSKTAVLEMFDFYTRIYNQTNAHLILHPQEHENVFRQFNYPSYLLYSDTRRWRTISHATHVFFTHAEVVKEYWPYFENTKYVGIKNKRHLGAEKETTDHLFKHIPGFSPIPAIAAHMQTEHCLPPFFNWRELWEEQEGCLE